MTADLPTVIVLALSLAALLALGVLFAQWWRVRAEARRDANLLTAVVGAAPDAIVTIDSNGLIQSFNPAAERIFGYAAAETVGRNVKMLMPPHFSERHDSFIANYLRTGEKRIIGIGRVVVGLRKDETTFPMELAVGEARSGNDRIFAGFVRDITRRQQADQRIQELQSELLHISRLSDMGQLASALAHELNQPLTAIANYAQASRLLLAGGSPADPARLVDLSEKVIDQAERAGQIIRRLRGFVEKREIERLPHDLNRLVEEACALALVGARDEGVNVVYNFVRDLPPVEVDKVQIQQVVVNLVRNAIEATRSTDRRELIVTTARRAPDLIAMTVRDSGAGIAPEIADRLFQPFVTTKKGGMGVGLSICLSIAEAHGGQLTAGPADGGGTVFQLTLPATRDAALV